MHASLHALFHASLKPTPYASGTSVESVVTAGWPSTMRFSRRLGEFRPGADYAQAIHAPPHGNGLHMAAVLLAVVAGSVVAAWTLAASAS